jgi:hypothetical protein
MVRKIVIENFMSHSLSVIEPCETLTVLTGPNNCGKSAVVAALQVLCRDEKGSYMLRHGQREASVLIETEDDHSVKWSRSKSNVVTYSIDGRDVHRGAPHDLHDVLLLPTVSMKDGKEEFDVHFGEQKRPIFLLNDSGSHAATFFASSSDAEYIVRMQALHKQRTGEAKSNEKRITQEIRGLDLRIDKLRPGLALSDRVTFCESQYEELKHDHSKIEAVDKANRDLREAIISNNDAKESLHPFLSLTKPPQFQDTASLEFCLVNLRTAQSSLTEIQEAQKLLSLAKAPPDFLDSLGLGRALSALQLAKVEHKRSKQRNELISKLENPPEQKPELALKELLFEVCQANLAVAFSKGCLLATKRLVQPPDLNAIEGLQESINTLEQAAVSYEEAKEFSQILSTIPMPSSYGDEKSLLGIVQDVREATAALDAITEVVRTLGNLNAVPEQFDTHSIFAVIQGLKLAAKQVEVIRTSVSDCEGSQKQVKSGLLEMLKLNPICPTCGQTVDEEALLKELEMHLA